jgi:hypothetical protein
VFYPGPIASVPDQWNSGVGTLPGVAGGVAGTMNFMANRPKFRARRVASQTVAENTHQFMSWDTIDADTESGWNAGDPTVYTAKVAGWYLATGRVSLSGTGAAQLVLIPALAVNGTSPTSIGSNGWEGPELPVPVGASTQPKISNGAWKFYVRIGDQVQLDCWYSTESAMTATDTTAGRWPALSLVWWGK